MQAIISLVDMPYRDCAIEFRHTIKELLGGKRGGYSGGSSYEGSLSGINVEKDVVDGSGCSKRVFIVMFCRLSKLDMTF